MKVLKVLMKLNLPSLLAGEGEGEWCGIAHPKWKDRSYVCSRRKQHTGPHLAMDPFRKEVCDIKPNPWED